MIILTLTTSMMISNCFAYNYPNDGYLNGLTSEMYGKDLGDCWGCAYYAFDKLKANGYRVAIVQGMSDTGVGNHRAIVIKDEGLGNPSNLYVFESQAANWRGTYQKDWFNEKNNPDALSIIEKSDNFDFDGSTIQKLHNIQFNGAYYLNKYTDVKNAGMDPGKHYIAYGEKEGRYPNQKMENIQFNKEYYLNKYTDVKNAGMDPIEHYMVYGEKEGRYANQILETDQFDRNYYLDANPDVKAAGMDPTEHYMVYGKKEGRTAHG
ncbi:MAG: Pseudogene of glycosyltransferase family 8 protein [Methanobrevibacter sp. CfCl-M3]